MPLDEFSSIVNRKSTGEAPLGLHDTLQHPKNDTLEKVSATSLDAPINWNEFALDDHWFDHAVPANKEASPIHEPGMLDKAIESGKAVLEGLTLFPAGMIDTVKDTLYGFDPSDKEAMRKRQASEAQRQAYVGKYEGKAFEGVAEAMTSLPYSMTTMAAGLAGGSVGALATAGNPVASGATAMGASGAAAYRATVAEFERKLYTETTAHLGREPAPEEWQQISSFFTQEATKYGLWEAGPEAISNLLMVKLLGPLGSHFKGGIKEAIKKIAGTYGEELGTETISQWGEGKIEADMGWREKAPTPVEAFKEIAPTTFWQTTLMAGGKKGLDLAHTRLKKAMNPDVMSEREDTSGLSERTFASDTAPGLPQERNTVPPRQANEPLFQDDALSASRSPAPEEIHFLKAQDLPYDGVEKSISPWRDKTTQTRYPSVIRSDQPVDLLSFNDNTPMAGLAGLEKNTSPTSRAVLPEDSIDVDYSVIPEGQGAFPPLPQYQLPAGTGRQSGFNGAGPETPLQGLSFLASPQMYQPQPEMPSTFPLPGNVGGKPGPQFSPTGGVAQLTPRADTTSHAQELDMTAPDMMPVPHRGLINLPFMRGATPTAPVNTPQQSQPPTVTQPQRLLVPDSISSQAQPTLESPVSPRPTPNIARAMTMAQRLQSGTMTPEELRTVYEAYRRNHPALAQELSLMSRSTLLSWVPPDMKRAARRSKRPKIAQMLLEYMDGLFSRPNTLSTNLKEENGDARSEEQKYGRTEEQGAIAQPGLESNWGQINAVPAPGMGIEAAQIQGKTLQKAFERKPEAEPLKSKESGHGRPQTRKQRREGSTQSTFPEFSDEVLAQKGERLRTTIVAEVPAKAIHKTPERSAIEAARDWVKQHITGPANTVIGEVEVDANAIQDSLSHAMYQNKLDAVQSIVPVLEKGEYLGSLPDKDGKAIDNFYFAGKVRIGEEEKIVFVRTRKSVGHTNKLYVHEVFTEDEIKKTGASERVFTDADRRFSNASEFYRSIIAKVLNVNEQSSQFPAGQQTSRQVHSAEQPIPSSHSENIEKYIAAQKPTIKSDLGENTEALSLEKPDREIIDKPHSKLPHSFTEKAKKGEEGQQTKERPKQQPKETPHERDVTHHMATKDSPKAKPFASLKEEGPQASDALPVAVVDVDPGIVPEFKKISDFVKWLKVYFKDKRTERIESTQKIVLFSNTGLSASTKRIREPDNRNVYGKLNDLIRKAVFERFKANDARHPYLGGQEIYYSAMRLGDKLYSVRFSLDVPSEAEMDIRRKFQPESKIEDLRFKGHELQEIEIAPIAENYGFEGHTATRAIRKITLGVLRDAVKPSRLENGVLSSIKPGEFLSPGRRVGPHVPLSAAEVVVNKLQERAANAAETQVVQSFEELPEHIRQAYGDEASRLEGVYDPETGKVYLVADNIRGIGRVAEVWMHENLAHHGLNGLVGKGEKRRILNRLWQRMGGLGNADLKEIAHRYGVDPRSDADARELVMEEYVANLAEKRAGDKLSGKDQTSWRRFVEAVLRAWNAVVDFVAGRTGTMRYENMDRLLAALDRYVFEGKPEGVIEQDGTASAMESRRDDPNNARFSPDTGKATDFVTLPDGSVDFAQFPEIRLMDYRLMKAASVRLQRGRHNPTGGNFGLRHIEANHGEDIRNAGYQNVQEFVWDLVNNFDEIWQGEGKSFLLVKNDGTEMKPVGFIELMQEEGYYRVKTAFPVGRDYPKRETRKQLWQRDAHDATTTGEQSPLNPFRAFRNPKQGQKGNLQRQRGQSVSTSIQHGEGERKPKASLRDIESVKGVIHRDNYSGIKISTEKESITPKPKPQKTLASLREEISEEAYPGAKSSSAITPVELKNDPDLALALKKLEEAASLHFGKGGMVFGRTGIDRYTANR